MVICYYMLFHYFNSFITNSVPAFNNVKMVEGYYIKDFTLKEKYCTVELYHCFVAILIF